MDEHLDTSWCPVCDKLILPRRFSVPTEAPVAAPNGPSQPPTTLAPPPLARQHSGRGKSGGNGNAYLKALARNHGGGLLHGTGRIRPGGGLKRNASTSNVVPTLQQQAQAQQPVPAIPIAARERIVIDQAQTPLYCSDECMKADLELANIPLSRSAPMNFPILRPTLGTHPSQLNPAVSSPPPQSPTLPPVPPNSFRSASNSQATRANLRLSLNEEVESSDSSLSAMGSGMMSNYSTSDASQTSPETEEQKTLTRPSQADLKGGEGDGEKGLQRVSVQLQSLLVHDTHANGKIQARPPKGLHNSTATLFSLSPSLSINSSSDLSPPKSNIKSPISPTSPSAKARARSAIELYAKYPLFSKSRSTSRSGSRQSLNLTATPTVSGSYAEAYAFSTSTPVSFTHASAEQLTSLPSETRESSAVSASLPVEQPNTSIGFGNLSKLYAGRKLSTRHTEPRSILAKGAEGKLLVPNVKLKPLGPDVGVGCGSAPTSLMDSVRVGRTVSGGGVGNPSGFGLDRDGGSVTGDTFQTQREGLPKAGRVASVRSVALRRDVSDPGVRRDSVRSPLGSVQEEGAWPHANERRTGKKLERQGSGSTQDAGSEGENSLSDRDTRADGRKTASASVSRRSSRKGSESGRKGREGLKLHERGRLNMQARTWSYDNLDSPTYESMPAVPITQIRLEEVFIPDPPSPSSPPQLNQNFAFQTDACPRNPNSIPTLSGSSHPPRLSSTSQYTFIDISPLHVHDTELSRRVLRDIGARRGVHEGVSGWWVEKEWEVIAIPERKRLFLFGSGLASKNASANGHSRLNA